MFKGIHNEAEFYTNFYFDNKLSSDLQSKVATFADIKDKTDKLKGLESFYWLYRDTKPSNESLLEFYQKLLTVLGYQFDLKVVDTLKETSFNSIVQVHAEERTNLYVFLTNEIEEGTFETTPMAMNNTENAETRELSEVISEFFDELENPPKWILVGSPTTMFLLERNKWAFGKYIKFNWDEIFQQKTDDLFTSILGLICKESLCPSNGQSIHAEMDDNSHRHAFEVTTELRESVRESIELLINEMIFQKKEKHQAYLSKVDSSLYAKELSHDALFYAYRLIFLLFLEAQAEDSELLPLKSEIYRHGYSLEKLLELIHDIPDEKTSDFEGTFAFESLQQIFSLIYNGFDYKVERDLLTDVAITNSGFLLKGIKSDLFSPDTVKHLKDIKLRNGVMLTVLRKLSLSSTGKGKNKRLTRVSYSNLGINQLGAVYEGLLSYSGFFAQEDLHALKPSGLKQSDIDNGKELDQIYLAPKSIVDKYSSSKEKKYKLSSENYVFDENGNPKIYKKGSFVYRLAGRDRQKLASFYTPESLTKCTVKYSLKVLFETKKTLDDLWNVKILEPAMGSGAFLNEAVNQIADRILELEIQGKVNDLKTPNDKQKRLWEIKYDLISKNVYGVDLNPTAIELARFSLWLNCIGAGKEPPLFNGRLKIGNSLIGARFKQGVDGIYPWLLLDEGMLNYGKRLGDFNSEAFAKLQKFRRDFLKSKLPLNDETLHLLNDAAQTAINTLHNSKDSDKKLNAYNSLKLCGDLWCSSFFLLPEDLEVYPKTHTELCEIFKKILIDGKIDPLLRTLVENKVSSQRFFHWDLEFASEIFRGGFDLILGNPPWVVVEWQDALYVSDYNVIPAVLGLNATMTREFMEALEVQAFFDGLLEQYIYASGYSNMLETSFYEILSGTPKNTYKAFDVLAFNLLNVDGAIGIIQEDGILEDKKAAKIRNIFYHRYQFHFLFQNEKLLFSEVHHAKNFSVNIFGGFKEIGFKHICNLFLPSTIDESLSSDGSGESPLIKDSYGQWNTTGHRDRVINIDETRLDVFKKFRNDHELESSRFLSLHSEPLMLVVQKVAMFTDSLATFCGEGESFIGSEMFHETGSQDKKQIYKSVVNGKIKPVDVAMTNDLILSGPHISSNNPISQTCREIFTSNLSYDKINIDVVPDNYCPRTLYMNMLSNNEIDKLFPFLQGKPFRSFFRLITRCMVDAANERSTFMAIVPPGVSHIHGLGSFAIMKEHLLPIFSGIAGSLIFDGLQRMQNKSHFFISDFKNIPIGPSKQYLDSIGRRSLGLNGVTKDYDSLWRMCVNLKREDKLITGKGLSGFGEGYIRSNTLRTSVDRLQAEIEIDALVALNFDLTSKELVQVYEILFPVLNKYDRQNSLNRIEKLEEAFDFFEKRGW